MNHLTSPTIKAPDITGKKILWLDKLHAIPITIFNRSIYGSPMLNDQVIRKLIEEKELITNYIDLEKQLQPSGFDISLKSVEKYIGGGAVDFTNKERVIANTTPVEPNIEGWYTLMPGCYKVIYNEIVKMPLDIAALARTRSTLLRNGASMGTAVWDPGYQGRSSSLLIIHNPHGILLKKNARIAQLVFYNTGQVEQGYSGFYQQERIS